MIKPASAAVSSICEGIGMIKHASAADWEVNYQGPEVNDLPETIRQKRLTKYAAKPPQVSNMHACAYTHSRVAYPICSRFGNMSGRSSGNSPPRKL
eukprot:1058034-Pelagomonas_calceolata.AAC.3